MKITILGSTGMLGSSVGKYFLKRYGEDNVFLSYRNKEFLYGKNCFFFDPLVDPLKNIPRSDYLINCIGVIKPFMKESMKNAIFLNSLFPWELAEYCNQKECQMIHITTDCVFSGESGNYDEMSWHDAFDDYGKTKSLGETTEAMVIRTSIIGEEIHKKASLVEWIKSQKGKEVNGFTNHRWNGITTEQYAMVCSDIIDKGFYEKDLFHVFSNIVTKKELLEMVNDRFKLGITVQPTESDLFCDRTLSTLKDLNGKLFIPPLKEQINRG